MPSDNGVDRYTELAISSPAVAKFTTRTCCTYTQGGMAVHEAK